VETLSCSRFKCLGRLIKIGSGLTPGSEGTYRCTFCYNLNEEQFKEKLKLYNRGEGGELNV